MDSIKLTGKLAEFRKALEEEITAVQKQGTSSISVSNCRSLPSSGDYYQYAFSVDYMPSLPADTPCKLRIGKDSYEVTVIGETNSELIISTSSELPDIVGKAVLDTGSTILMERLISRIEKNASVPNPAGERMLQGNVSEKIVTGLVELSFTDQENNNQKAAIRNALTKNLTYIWGPPGTGKTTVIKHIILGLMDQDRSVLLVSHTNTAVDGALGKVIKEYDQQHGDGDDLAMYPILRLGYGPERSLDEKAYLDAHQEIAGKKYIERKKELEQKKEEIEKELKRINDARWLCNNQLGIIEGKYDQILKLYDQSKSEEEKLSDIQEQISVKEQEQPELRDYRTTVIEIEKIEKKIIALKNMLIAAEAEERKVKSAFEEAKDNRARCIAAEGYKAQLDQKLSLPAQEARIKNVEAAITDIKGKITRCENEQAALMQIVESYEKKGAIGKLLAGSRKYNDALAELTRINDQLDRLRAECITRETLLIDYKGEIRATQLLAAKLQDVSVVGIAEEWTEKCVTLQAEISRNSIFIEKYKREISLLQEEKALLQQKIVGLEDLYGEIKKLEDEYKQRKGYLETLHKQAQNEQNELNQFIDQELFAVSISADGLPIGDKIDKLEQHRIEISESLQGVDIDQLLSQEEPLQRAIRDIDFEIKEITYILQNLLQAIINDAKVIGTTLTKAYLSDELQNRKFDTVILDEASMASIPALWCTAYMAERNIVIVGDFLQLPPIVMSDEPEAKQWLGTDIFKKSGVQESIINEEKYDCCIVLDEQYRMEKTIAEIANEIIYNRYHVPLKSKDDDQKIEKRNNFYGWFNHEGHDENRKPVNLVDTDNLHAWVNSVPMGKYGSRVNVFSAGLVPTMAFEYLDRFVNHSNETGSDRKTDEPVIIILAPYRAHVENIKELVNLEYKERGIENRNAIQVGTIHSFQGKEADIVIFDLVVDEPHRRANLFMPENHEIKDEEDSNYVSDIRKLFNVAITRAKFKLFIVGNLKFCRKRAEKYNALYDLLEYCYKNKFPVLDANEVYPTFSILPRGYSTSEIPMDNRMLICDSGSFDRFFLSDLSRAQEYLVMFSPFMTSDRLGTLAGYFRNAVQKGVKVIVVTKDIEEHGIKSQALYKKCKKELEDLGVTVIHRKNMHEKFVFIDGKIVWFGSLNVLSFNGKTGETMTRIEESDDHKTKDHTGPIQQYEKQQFIGKLLEMASTPSHMKCPICGQTMQLAEGNKGGYYWRCTNKNSSGEIHYSQGMEVPYPENGILHCKRCNAEFGSYKITPKQMRWICSVDSAHYQTARISDFKLPGMRALVKTKEEQKQINDFFSKATGKKCSLFTEERSTKDIRTEKTTTSYEQMNLFDFMES